MHFLFSDDVFSNSCMLITRTRIHWHFPRRKGLFIELLLLLLLLLLIILNATMNRAFLVSRKIADQRNGWNEAKRNDTEKWIWELSIYNIKVTCIIVYVQVSNSWRSCSTNQHLISTIKKKKTRRPLRTWWEFLKKEKKERKCVCRYNFDDRIEKTFSTCVICVSCSKYRVRKESGFLCFFFKS